MSPYSHISSQKCGLHFNVPLYQYKSTRNKKAPIVFIGAVYITLRQKRKAYASPKRRRLVPSSRRGPRLSRRSPRNDDLHHRDLRYDRLHDGSPPKPRPPPRRSPPRSGRGVHRQQLHVHRLFRMRVRVKVLQYFARHAFWQLDGGVRCEQRYYRSTAADVAFVRDRANDMRRTSTPSSATSMRNSSICQRHDAHDVDDASPPRSERSPRGSRSLRSPQAFRRSMYDRGTRQASGTSVGFDQGYDSPCAIFSNYCSQRFDIQLFAFSGWLNLRQQHTVLIQIAAFHCCWTFAANFPDGVCPAVLRLAAPIPEWSASWCVQCYAADDARGSQRTAGHDLHDLQAMTGTADTVNVRL